MVWGLEVEKRERETFFFDPYQLIIKLVIALSFYVCDGDTRYFVIAWWKI